MKTNRISLCHVFCCSCKNRYIRSRWNRLRSRGRAFRCESIGLSRFYPRNTGKVLSLKLIMYRFRVFSCAVCFQRIFFKHKILLNASFSRLIVIICLLDCRVMVCNLLCVMIVLINRGKSISYIILFVIECWYAKIMHLI